MSVIIAINLNMLEYIRITLDKNECLVIIRVLQAWILLNKNAQILKAQTKKCAAAPREMSLLAASWLQYFHELLLDDTPLRIIYNQM